MAAAGDRIVTGRRTRRFIGVLVVLVLVGIGTRSPVEAQTCPCSIWTPGTLPATANASDTRAVEVGVKFRSDVAGFVTAIRFYKGSLNTGSHTGSVWTTGGILLGRVVFANETASGWQQATFASPVAIAANTTYIASYHAPVGRYAVNSQYFQTGVDNPPLHAPANSVTRNGVYRYSGTPTFPSQSFQASNYWVDVVFNPSLGPDTTPPTVTSVTPTDGAAGVNVGTTVTATFSEAMNAATINTDTFQLQSAAGLVAATVAYNATTRVATLTPTSPLATATTYTATVRGGLTDPRVKDAADNALSASVNWSFTTTTTTDTTPPTVTSVSPAAGATNVSTASTVTATFSEPMDATTITGDTFQLRDSGNTLISALVTYNATTRVATLAPSGALASGATYTATVRGGPTDPRPKDVAGNALANSSVWSFTTSGGTGGPCTTNPIVCENNEPGNPESDWDVAGAGDPSIQGFATDISVNKGQTVTFKISTNASAYRLDIYRMGYYRGAGARRVATVRPTIPLPQAQPPCLTEASTGLVDCGNWANSVSWAVPPTATSGIYFAKLVREAGAAGASHIVFVVRDDAGQAPILFQTSDTTWQAYNQYGGNSLYVGSPAGRAYKVSYNRPFTTRGTAPEDWVFNAEYPMVRWLEANGYHVSYFTGVDTDRIGAQLTQHRVFLSVGHDEYWSGGQRANIETARNAGVHLAFFSGNEVFWKTRWENSIDASQTPYRTLVCYKETHANAKIDPLPGVWTGTWRDPRFSPPADGGRPENALTGTLFTVNDGATTAITVPEPFGKLRFWRNTSVASLPAGQTATMPNGTLGYEWDEDVDNGVRPPGLIQLSSTTRDVPGKLQDFGSTYAAGTATHSLTLYRHPNGALVFGAGTVQWSWGLDSNHDRGSANPDVRMQQATVNLLADMGVQPQALQPGLVLATASTDTTSPTSTITSPQAGATLPVGQAVTISGTAADTGGLVAGVEVSVDNGATWRRANGRGTWSFAWTPQQNGTFTIRSRATDDSARTEAPAAGITVTVGTGGGGGGPCPCTLWASSETPAVASDSDAAAIEVGVKFRADVDGTITGIRFYKGALNTGTHVGSLWTAAGQRLASVTFTNETASGWQQANFPTPVPITASTTYVASYHAPVGRYAVTENYFATTGVDRPPLHAPATSVTPNGVYQYGPSAFPTSTFAASNYWVDVVFTPGSATPDTTPPTVTAVTPADDASGIAANTTVTATFSEAMNAATINGTTFELRGPADTPVAATVAYDAATRVATLTPGSALATSTLYTATVRGGATDPRVTDLAGNALAANMTWSFTTASSAPPPSDCPCTIWAASTTPATPSVNDAQAVEVGVKFRSDVSGFISGIRFYKGSQNTGTHVGKLWSSAGQLLGSATFSNETAAGWQQVNFPSPIAITANSVYVASYHTTSGFYAANSGYFASTGTDRPPLHALATTVSPNGVFAYGPGAFPTQTFNATNYWVDVVFNTTGGTTPPDTAPPTVAQVTPSNGTSGVSLTTNVVVTFSEPMDPATITSTTLLLRNVGTTAVPATVTYDPATLRATLDPTDQLAASSTYTVEVRGGSTEPRVKDVAGNALATTFTSSFATGSSTTPPPPGQGPGGPILVVTHPQNKFGAFYAEILTTEGLNAFAVADISTVTSSLLAQHDVVILAEMPLTAAQVTMLSDWVAAGGNLIAMRPDKQLTTLLGLQDQGTTLSNAYLLVNTSQPPGAGIVGETIQFHGPADRYAANGATVVATLYASPSASTANPAVSVRTVGALGGQAAAFTYDLARSVVYMRQGNPDWAGEERDGTAPIRSDDLYFGAAAGDIRPDWVNLDKVAIPQADEQQRLLANLIVFMNADRKPLPRFWYFPRGLNAVVVMTGDDHANGGTAGRFDQYRVNSSPGCSVDNWECIRGTSYIYVDTPLTNEQAVAYEQDGFEIGVHVNTGCADWTPTSLQNFYADQLTAFATKYPGLPQPVTNRTHCIVWSDWATQAKVALGHGIGLDTNYYYWPPQWIADRPGFFTGSGMPMRFADTDGTIVDVYQATTQMTDESGQSYPFTVNTLLDRAVGPLGYYGAFTANMHTDSPTSSGSDAIVASARARGVPVVSARQMLTWLDGRNASSFSNVTWNGTALSFSILVGSGANGLQAMVPAASGGRTLTTLTRDGSPVTVTTRTVKGVAWAVFPALPGTYQASYATP